ncbi:hypothetical protein B0H14DRAFT_2623621 [Mycena olivaceomarginata]|nr:hypothetical protein B0H14DRAFT_2623621 [Mycena olivaceomarginata]
MSLREGENGERRRTQGGMLRRVKLAKAQGLPKARGKKAGEQDGHGSFRAESNSHGETKDDIARVLTEMVRERWIEIGSHREKESRWGRVQLQKLWSPVLRAGVDMAEHDAHVTDEEAKTTAEYLGRNLQEDRMKQFMWKVGD